ncbi:MAG TPA: HD-GYP domain-containing protein [Vicinamibacterales bacterium]|jgi:putative nucleotidyltransferase with HDIG domain
MSARTPPRFVVRTMIATFSTVGLILAAVFLVVTVIVRDRVRNTVVAHLSNEQTMLATLEARRASEMQAQAETLAESPTVKAAMDTYQAEMSTSDGERRRDLFSTVQREVDELASRLRPDILAVAMANGTVVATGGRRHAEWPRAFAGGVLPSGEFVVLPTGVFRVAAAPLTFGPTVVGYLQLGSALDAEYAAQLTALSGASAIITAGDAVVAGTLPPGATRALTPAVLTTLPSVDTVELRGEQFAVRKLLQYGAVSVYVLESIDSSAHPILSDTLGALALIALVALALAGLASMALARSVARPIHTLTASLTHLAGSGGLYAPVARTGSSLEVDTLTDTFNNLMATLTAAEAETRSTYVGAIRALALALDARDPYTAGHSERVSAISAAVGEHLGLAEDDLDVLRLGALLHDIGKIGISDDVLRKPGPLTDEEFEAIKEHPTTGARILRSVAFLAPHLPIVELHHERPDGRGYPHGLVVDEIPMLPRIVHVVDAFDAMTSARAYRPALGAAEALKELWRCAGTQFDAEVVQALAATLPTFRLEDHRFDAAAARAGRKGGVIAFNG